MEHEAGEYFDTLYYIGTDEDAPLHLRYKQLRDLLERVCRANMQGGNLQLTDLSARINYIAATAGLTVAEQNRLHTFRLTSNAILNRQEEPEAGKLMRDVKTIAFFVRKLYAVDIPPALYHLLPRADATYIQQPPSAHRVERMRVSFEYADDDYLYVIPADSVSDTLVQVRYNVPQVNEEFADTCSNLWRFAQLNLLDVSVDEAGVLTPTMIVLEPDYLVDISSLAECYKDYGHHPAVYQLNKLHTPENTVHMLLGNIANLFLDEWIYAPTEPDYRETMQKVFVRYAIELAACTDLKDAAREQQFFKDCRMHFDNIRTTVLDTFRQPGYKLDKADAVLEPSYICEPLGLQGRLDYMQRDGSAIIEMKSGKADEYVIRNKVVPKENHQVQMLLYQAVLQYSTGADHHHVNAYLFYTRYPLLYPARSSWAMVKRAINLRNLIVTDEYGIQLRNSISYTTRKLGEIKSDVLNTKGLGGRFWEQYLRPSIDRVREKLASLSAVEKAYFHLIYTFIVKEQYTAKSGDTAYEGNTGASSLWLSTFDAKCESGEILYDLRITDNHAADPHKAHVILARQSSGQAEGVVASLPNFRQGDAVVLYQRNVPSDNATNRMVFKGNLEYISETEVCVRLRATQQNLHVLPADSLYAIEHDFMDTSFRNMFAGLATFPEAGKDRRELLLGVRPPQFDPAYDNDIAHAPDDFHRVALKALAAHDYFLLIGPPGTGKTSRALRLMVETFHKQPDTDILLLAYTNRAVDEICKALCSITPAVDFIRVGSELSCEPPYRQYLIENVLAGCTRRQDVRDRIGRCRIFVGTVATLSNRPELFKLKTFDIAIIDEATQILEPQLLGILCAPDGKGGHAIGKFVMIGDHKQLPAVVLQSPEQTEVTDEALRELGIHNLKDSLFERLYRRLKQEGGDTFCRATDTLTRQGRMHPSVASFPNKAFYGGGLNDLGLPHQVDEQAIEPVVPGAIRLTSRVVFVPSIAGKPSCSAKTNISEARLAASLVLSVWKDTPAETFDVARTIGIITPYRNQIALIRQEIAKLGVDSLNDILIDTVERFQGSERDVIIYSFCVNHPWQLRMLSNTIEEDGGLIDRKLNVALTRARKGMYILGVQELLRTDEIYQNLLDLRE